MRNQSFFKKTLFVFFSILSYLLNGQVTFNATNTGLQTVSGSSFANCAVDMNGDGLDDIVRVLGSGIYIDYQQPNGVFTGSFFPMSLENLPSWSICAADIDDNGYTDLCLGAGDAVSFVYANDNGTAYTEDAHPEYIFSQRSTFADIDNDGKLDAFVCHDVDQSHAYHNINGILQLDISLLPTLDAGGNYAAIWVDYDNDWDSDLYITKCRGGAPAGDPQRINLLYRNNGDGTFSSVGPEANMDDGDQSWATVFEDFDNDGDFDAFTVNHQWANRFMENNGDGTFTDIIGSTGIDAGDLGAWNCDAHDFDNNGFVDIFSEMNNEMYWNNGNGTFTGGQLSFSSGGVGDFNNDGFLDVISVNTRHMNNGNSNNWVKFHLEGIVTAKDAIGARVEIYGDWGIQIREVRAGESFDPGSSLTVHFGLGQATAINQVIVKWPSGMITTIENPEINQQHLVLESNCILDPVALVVNGNTNLCEGQSVVLSAPDGDSYFWSNGETTQSIQVSSGGNYSVVVYDESDCVAMSNQVEVNVIIEEDPSISASGDTYFCEGGSVVLTASPSSSYLWNGGETSSTIVVTESGVYNVSTTGLCSGNPLVSQSIEVIVLDSPEPGVENIQIGESASIDITASGTNVEWFESETADFPMATGNTYTTPVVESEATYWVQSTTIYGGEEQSGGKPDFGSGGLPSTGGRMFFNVTEPFTLVEFKCNVPASGVAGNRTLQIFDAAGALITTYSFFAEIGDNVISCDIEVPSGEGLQLALAENNLFRNNSGVAYPYPIGDIGEITNSTFGSSYYYYFYDWKIEKESMECVSDRVPVTVTVVSTEEITASDWSIYPVPVKDQLNIRLPDGMRTVNMRIIDATGRVVIETMKTSNDQALLIIPTEAFTSGIYTLSISNENHIIQKTFVIEK